MLIPLSQPQDLTGLMISSAASEAKPGPRTSAVIRPTSSFQETGLMLVLVAEPCQLSWVTHCSEKGCGNPNKLKTMKPPLDNSISAQISLQGYQNTACPLPCACPAGYNGYMLAQLQRAVSPRDAPQLSNPCCSSLCLCQILSHTWDRQLSLLQKLPPLSLLHGPSRHLKHLPSPHSASCFPQPLNQSQCQSSHPEVTASSRTSPTSAPPCREGIPPRA